MSQPFASDETLSAIDSELVRFVVERISCYLMYPVFGHIGGERAVANVSHDIFRLTFD